MPFTAAHAPPLTAAEQHHFHGTTSILGDIIRVSPAQLRHLPSSSAGTRRGSYRARVAPSPSDRWEVLPRMPQQRLHCRELLSTSYRHAWFAFLHPVWPT